MLGGGRLGENINMREELIKKACSLAMKAHSSSSGKPYHLHKKSQGSSEAVFSFAASWAVDDWFSHKPFGETKVNLDLFPSLKSIGNGDVAAVNEAFFRRFEAIRRTSSFEDKVKKAVKEKKQIVFAGHSSGGAMAMLATLWFLENYLRPNSSQTTPVCVTFGSPLVGDRIFPHALRRENWDSCFVHFVMRYDIVPRIMLAPLSSMEQELLPILQFFNPKSAYFKDESIAGEASTFFMTVMRNVSSVASHAACNLIGFTNSLLDTVTSFIQLSPYRPFGTYIFCTGNGKLVVVKNPDAILQLLFYSSQLISEAESAEVAYKSLMEHLVYENELQESLEMQNVVYLDSHLQVLPLSSDGNTDGETATVNTALNDFGLSTRARLCLRAAGELQKQKLRNQDKIVSNKNKIEAKLKSIREYYTGCYNKLGYYDAFKCHNDIKDFHANVTRLELAGMWDEIIEMLKKYELPDEFEGCKEWIELGTEYRRLVEPLDIANYYRHLKNVDTKAYLIKGSRPKRYKYTQSWREHDERIKQESSSESCFWAEVEELRSNNKSFEDMKQKILDIERDVLKWVKNEEIGEDVFLVESTFSKWWKTLPDKHRKESCLANLMSN